MENTASALVGSARRMFMAEVVELLGWGGQRYVEKTFGWDRKTIRKGRQERDAGEPALDGRCRSGRKKAEEHVPGCWTISSTFSTPQGKPTPPSEALEFIRQSPPGRSGADYWNKKATRTAS